MSSFLITHLPPNKDSSTLVEFLIRNDFVFTFGQTSDELHSWVRAKNLIYAESQKAKMKMIPYEGEIEDNKPKEVTISPNPGRPVVSIVKSRVVAPAVYVNRVRPAGENPEPTFLAPRNKGPPLRLRTDYPYTPTHTKYAVRSQSVTTATTPASTNTPARIVYKVHRPQPPLEEEKPPVEEEKDMSFMKGSKHAELLMEEDDDDEEVVMLDEATDDQSTADLSSSSFNEDISLPTNYKCPLPTCGTEFTRQNLFLEHMELHPGVQPFHCSKCGKSYSQSGSLNRHMRVHTGETPYACTYCDKKFAHPELLKCHLRTHTGERPYECYVCFKRFTQSHSLKEHLRLHTGEKPYQCNYCDKRFNHQGTLQKHLRVHTGEKPFECHVCLKKFRQAAYLKQHLWVIHAEVSKGGSSTPQINNLNDVFAQVNNDIDAL